MKRKKLKLRIKTYANMIGTTPQSIYARIKRGEQKFVRIDGTLFVVVDNINI